MIALVTGGTKGIGLAITKALRAQGHLVAVVSRNAPLYKDYDICIRADLASRRERNDLILKVVLEFGGLDILINNAGEQESNPAELYSYSQWDRQIELLLTAPFELARQAKSYLLKSGRGRIINISSVAGITGTRGIIGYSVAKAGLIEMTKCLSNEWLSDGITVNAIAPGFIDTEMQTLKGKHKEDMLGRIPAGRLGTPQEVANAVCWLASKETDYISGICLPIDGGWLAR